MAGEKTINRAANGSDQTSSARPGRDLSSAEASQHSPLSLPTYLRQARRARKNYKDVGQDDFDPNCSPPVLTMTERAMHSFFLSSKSNDTQSSPCAALCTGHAVTQSIVLHDACHVHEVSSLQRKFHYCTVQMAGTRCARCDALRVR